MTLTGNPMAVRAVAAALDAAIETGLVARLMDRPASATELRASLDLDELGLARVLDVLEVGGVLERRGEEWAVTKDASPHLRGPDGHPQSLALWQQVPAFLRAGECLLPPRDLSARERTYSAHVHDLAAKFRPDALRLASVLAPRLPERARVLDIGAGAAPWSLPLLAERPDAALVALDLPAVTERALEAAREAGLEDRVQTLAGDYHELELPEADVVLLAAVLHLEAPTDARALLARAGRALAPGGLLVVIDALAPSTPAGHAARVAYALHLALRVPGGYPHEERDLRAWLGEAGFPRVERLITNQMGGALLAVRDPGGKP
jgi:ubiquinone/menaquinone biosynthesis C-methylase UbiE